MTTAIVFSNQDECKLLIGDGDWTAYDRVWVNSGKTASEDGLSKLLYPDETGELAPEEVTSERFAEEVRNGAEVIVCGFLL